MQPVRRVGLHVHLEHAAELVELVDVARAEIGGERREHVAHRDPQALRLGAVHDQPDLRDVGAEGGDDVLQRRLLVRLVHHRLRGREQLAVVEAAVALLDLEREAP